MPAPSGGKIPCRDFSDKGWRRPDSFDVNVCKGERQYRLRGEVDWIPRAADSRPYSLPVLQDFPTKTGAADTLRGERL